MIEIDDRYFIDASDRSNFTLKEIVPASTKEDGTETKERELIHGYFGSFHQALTRYVDVRMHDADAANVDEVLAELRAIHATIRAMPDLSRTSP